MSSSGKVRYKLVYTVPPSKCQATKEAVFAAGAGVYDNGTYVECAFEAHGFSQYVLSTGGRRRSSGSTPPSTTRMDEVKVEVTCDGREVVKAAVAALKEAHPYETVWYEVFKIEDF